MFYFNVKLFIVCKCGNKKKDTIGSILLQKVIRFCPNTCDVLRVGDVMREPVEPKKLVRNTK